MPWNLPLDVLSALRSKYLTDPKSLEPQEIEIAQRTHHCQNCHRHWLARTKRGPLRCPKCHRYRYNTPTIDRLMHELHPQPQTPPNTSPQTSPAKETS